MADSLLLEIVTPTERLLELEVDEVDFPGTEGSLGVLPGHTPLLTTLGTGELSYRSAGTKSELILSGGFAEVLPDRVTLLADLVESPEDVDVESARADQQEAEEQLKTATPENLDEVTATLRLAEIRIAKGSK